MSEFVDPNAAQNRREREQEERRQEQRGWWLLIGFGLLVVGWPYASRLLGRDAPVQAPVPQVVASSPGPAPAAAVVSPDAPACYAAVMDKQTPRPLGPPEVPAILVLLCTGVDPGASVEIVATNGVETSATYVPLLATQDNGFAGWVSRAATPWVPGMWVFEFRVDGQLVARLPFLVVEGEATES